MPAIDVPVEQRAEYKRILKQLFLQCQDMDLNLGKIYLLLKQDDLLKKLIAIVSRSWILVCPLSLFNVDMYCPAATVAAVNH